MFETFISLFGIAIVYRNLSLLEKFEVLSKKNLSFYFILLQLPLFLFIIFKDQIQFTLIYIGIFSLTLIFYRRILIIFAESAYEKGHLHILDQLILLLKSGKSTQASLKIVLSGFSSWQKLVFRQLESIFEIKSTDRSNLFEVSSSFFVELQIILRSSNQVVEQLKSFREGLRIRHNLRHKSRQVTQQIRAQAMISVFIFATLLYVSFTYLNLKDSLEVVALSVLLFLIGFTLIFMIGGRIQWKT
jgi:hypothetical protein